MCCVPTLHRKAKKETGEKGRSWHEIYLGQFITSHVTVNTHVTVNIHVTVNMRIDESCNRQLLSPSSHR